MKNILFVRHAQTQWNVNKRFQGISDVPLNSKGIYQAEKIGEKLSEYKIDEIYSSPLKRALNTAQKIAHYHNLHISTHRGLREIGFGPWEGKTKDEILSLGYDNIHQWKKCPEKIVLPDNSTLKDVQKRGIECVRTILGTTEKENILFVSHGGVLKLIMIGLLNLDISFYKQFWLGNTSLSIIKIRDNKYTLDLLNDMCHLDEREM